MKQVLVLRKDLNMRKGKMIAQGAHAAVDAVLAGGDDPRVHIWLAAGAKKIAVSVDSEDELLAIFAEAKARGLLCTLIRDSGRTEFHGVPTHTAVAVGPGPEEEVDAVTGALKLL